MGARQVMYRSPLSTQTRGPQLHVVCANLLIPKFIANRVSIGPVAATIGILFWGLVVGCDWLATRCTTHSIDQADCRFAPVLVSLLQHAGSNAASGPTQGTIRRNSFGTGNSFLAPPSWKTFGSAQTLGEPGMMIARQVRQRLADKLFSKRHLCEG